MTAVEQPVDPSFAALDRGTWKMLAFGLMIAAALYLIGGVFYSYAVANSGGGASGRTRISTIASLGASVLTGIFVLACVLSLIQAARVDSDPPRLRPAFAIAFALAVVVLLLAAFSVWDIASAKHATGELSGLSGGSRQWNLRLASMAPRVAAGVLAACAMVLANRRSPLRVVEGEPGEAFAE